MIVKKKVLNLYCGIGGNRKLWEDVEVTAIEYREDIAQVYRDYFPEDTVIVCDAHEYLLKHYMEYDFIWSSPPCPSHSQFRFRCGHLAWGQEALYPDMALYQEIILLKYYFKGMWVVENVESYYEPLIPPQKCARHYFWTNFKIGNYEDTIPMDIKKNQVDQYSEMHGYDLSKYKIENKRQVLRNCVEPKLGQYIMDCAMNIRRAKEETQISLF